MDRILALLAFAVLLGFLGILFAFVPRINLGLVLLLALVMAAYDFVRSNRRGKNNDKK